MTRQYATLKLFEHGPLTRAEFIGITGWSKSSCEKQLSALTDAGQLKREKFGTYSLATGDLV